ncbi:MAG: acetyl-CoA C-acetyltransferase, partial [Chromatiales bacterium]|nr:acetyl-CoA C-acetyltransferase [Chromatiales bacterium]
MLSTNKEDFAVTEVVIAGAVRTAIGAFNGALSTLSAAELGSAAIVEALRRAGVQPDEVSEVIM